MKKTFNLFCAIFVLLAFLGSAKAEESSNEDLSYPEEYISYQDSEAEINPEFHSAAGTETEFNPINDLYESSEPESGYSEIEAGPENNPENFVAENENYNDEETYNYFDDEPSQDEEAYSEPKKSSLSPNVPPFSDVDVISFYENPFSEVSNNEGNWSQESYIVVDQQDYLPTEIPSFSYATYLSANTTSELKYSAPPKLSSTGPSTVLATLLLTLVGSYLIYRKKFLNAK